MEAVVQFDYAAREPDELTLKKGDVITDVRPMPDGWMEGLKEGKKGMFPDNYVKIVHNSSGVVLRKKNPRKCKVLFSYKPANRDELELNIDDVIEVLGEVEEGWWKGELRNEVGVFPSNYVTEITDTKNVSRSDSKTSTGSLKKEDSVKKDKNAVETPTLADNAEINAPVLPPKPVKEVCVALFPYEAVNSDELTLAEGDIVTILSREVEDKGWWKGELKGKIGVFPDNFVQLLNQDELAPKTEKSATSPRSSGTTASLRKVFQSQMENKSLGPVVSKKPALPPPPPTTKKPPTAKTATASLSKTLSGIKSMLSSDQNAAEKIKHIGSEMTDSKQYGSIAVKRSESVGSMKKTPDSPDGSCMSRSSYNVTPLSIPESSPLLVPTNHDNVEPKSPDFDQIERTAMLSHPTASRAKAPRRRPPSAAFSVPIEDDPVLSDPPPTNGIPGVDKEKAPWVQELKMNQAKKSTTNSVIGGGRTRVMISPSTTTITSESSETTTVTSWSGLTSVGVGGVVFKPPGYTLPLTTPEPVTVSTPTSPVAFVSADFGSSTPSAERSQIAVLNEKVKQLESTVQQQNCLIDKLSSKLDVEMVKRMEIEKEIKKIMELVTRV